MKRLVLDLRGNPGGQLDQAIRITNRFVAEGLDGRLHARPRAEFRFGLSRHRAGRVPDDPDGHARQSQQRQRVGNRVRRAAGLRSLARRRRDDVRQGARAVGVSRQRRRRPGADDRALLHAERPLDSASVGRHVRRVPDLHAEGSERAREVSRSVEVHDRRAQGVSRAAASSPTCASTVRSKDSTRRASAARCTAAGSSCRMPSSSAPKATRASATRVRRAAS